jgi:uncharacterized damage-inducible protein DinB
LGGSAAHACVEQGEEAGWPSPNYRDVPNLVRHRGKLAAVRGRINLLEERKMAIRDALLPEFDMEMASTRKMLERVPVANLDFKPHDKSGSLGWLAWHVADLPAWVVETVNKDELDFAPIGQPRPAPPKMESREQLLASFDKKVADARTAIAGVSDERLAGPWTLKAGGHTIFTMPRAAVLRSFVMNHLIHHRAQLGVYLRLNDVPVPGMYGPSADEKGG